MTVLSSIDQVAVNDDVFGSRLLAGERLVWTGRPGQGLLLTPRDAFLIPFSLLWCGFSVFWLTTTARARAPIFFLLWGGMFLCVGLFFVVGRFVLDAWLRRRLRYALTNRRILIYRPGPFSDFTALGLDRLPDARLSERADGRGSIRFGQAVSMWGNRGVGSWVAALEPTPQFLLIDDARNVFDQIQRAGRTAV